MKRWTEADVRITLVDPDRSGDIVTLRCVTPDGEVVIMGEVVEEGGWVILERVHMHGPGANSLSLAGLRLLARMVMELADVDSIEVRGATRTTGAGPGRRPRPLRFRR